MEEIKQKVQDLELALNYVCYDADLIPKLSKVWEKLELLQEVVNKKCNIQHVMPRLICHYNEREGGYLTIGKTYQAISIDEDGWLIKDDSGDYNIYSSAYLNEA